MNKKGFTLMELLIVIAVIGILAVALISTFVDSPAEARDKRRITDLRKIYEFINANYVATGQAIPGDTNGTNSIFQCIRPGTLIGDAVNLNLEFFDGIFPDDEHGGGFCGDGSYLYYRFSGTSKYTILLITRMENKENGNCRCTLGQLRGDETFDDTGTLYVLPVQK